ncbi:MAG TPA: ligase-associated DNA damage response endonuclease PdeM [Fimbriimonadaceae bacterium]
MRVALQTSNHLINLLGEELELLADKALFWPARQALFIADVHFGKAAAFRAQSVAIPGGTTTTDLARITNLLDETGASSLYILGDMWHAKEGLAQQTLQVIRDWRSTHTSLEITLVMGNHDRKCGELPQDLNVRTVDEPLKLSPFTLLHDPAKAVGAYSFGGHIHPCVRLAGFGGQSERVPCFWFGQDRAVLPAFGSFTGCSRVVPAADDQVYVAIDGKVLKV